MGIVQGSCLFHHPDAPIEVSGEAVLQVVGFHKGSFGKEGLMADQHALLEASPGKRFRGGEAAHADEVPFLIHQRCFAIQHVGQFAAGDGVHHLLQGVVFVEAVAGIEEAEVIAGGKSDAFVHGVVQSLVRFAHDAGDAVFVPVDDGECAVFGRTVHNDVFHVVVGLRDNALNRVLQYRFGVVGHGDDAEFRGKVVMHFFRSLCCKGQCISWQRRSPNSGIRLSGRLVQRGWGSRARSASSRCRWQSLPRICIVPRSRCAGGLSSRGCRPR